nr:hypothetical protein [Tanacetum cinerariifolium]
STPLLIVGVEWRCGSDGSGDGDSGGGSGVTRWWWHVGESGVGDRFWNTAVVKRTGDVTRILHSLSAKRTSWNEFSFAMTSALICLSSGQRFNFSKYIFESLVRNVDSSSKFYMYPRFIQLIIQTNIADLSKHTNRYIFPVLTQKVFANMRRVGKGFSGVETLLFETMLAVRDVPEEAKAQVPTQGDDVQEHAAEEVATDVVSPTPTSPSP